MKVVIAPDSFAGTLSAPDAAAAIADGWRRVAPDDELVLLPLSDGGPGFVAVLAASIPGRIIEVATTDPLGRAATGALLLDGTTCYLESAQAAGLHLLAAADRDPLRATSYGVGVLLAAAVEGGARTVVVGLGGSASNDGGAGMLAALGVIPVDAGGSPLSYGGQALCAVAHIAGPGAALRGVALLAATDVDNPLLGPHGATAVFGPQKGVAERDIPALDAGLARWASVLEGELPGCPHGLTELPGAGAAGGLGVALFALGASRTSGIGLVAAAVGLPEAIAGADLVITGEGSFDWQSLRGKVAVGVATTAAESGTPCLLLARQVAAGRTQLASAGIEAAYAVAEHAGSIPAALSYPAQRLADLAATVAKQWSGAG